MTILFAKKLSLSDIMSHIGAVDTVDTRLRCLTEGEAVLKARHIICCGVKTCTETLLTVQGLWVQTSHVQYKPHELEFAYSLDGTIKGHCSWKAGNSERCKHLVAMMLLVNRTGIQKLEPLTCTDLKQAWGKLQAAPMYEARELQDVCHVQALPDLNITEEARQRIRQRLVARLPESALALHIQGRQQQRNAAATHLELTIEHQLLQHICSSDMVVPYTSMLFYDVAFKDATECVIYRFTESCLSDKERNFYCDNVVADLKESLRLCVETRSQDNTKWHRERKLRITGSRCHAYFTFLPKENNSWEDMASRMLIDEFRGNYATRYGKSCEQVATEAYTEMTGTEVFNVGFVVHRSLPWLGYIPDGVTFKEGVPAILLEVKSPVLGQHVKAADLVKEKKLNYIKLDGHKVILKRRHSYYSQVKLGMFFMNLSSTHFLIYSKVEPLMIVVEHCDEYIDKLVRKLQFVYFKHLLPKLAEAV